MTDSAQGLEYYRAVRVHHLRGVRASETCYGRPQVTFRRRLEFDSINEANEFLEFLEVADGREHRTARIEK